MWQSTNLHGNQNHTVCFFFSISFSSTNPFSFSSFNPFPISSSNTAVVSQLSPRAVHHSSCTTHHGHPRHDPDPDLRTPPPAWPGHRPQHAFDLDLRPDHRPTSTTDSSSTLPHLCRSRPGTPESHCPRCRAASYMVVASTCRSLVIVDPTVTTSRSLLYDSSPIARLVTVDAADAMGAST
jgi:hypothetical protein